MVGKATYWELFGVGNAPCFSPKSRADSFNLPTFYKRIQIDYASIFCGFSLPFFEEGVQPYISPDHSLFLLGTSLVFKLVIRFLHDKSSRIFDDLLGFGREPLRLGQVLFSHTRHHTSVWGWQRATLPRDPPSECLGLPHRNELKWTLEHVSVKAGPTVWLLWSSASGTCAKLQRLGGNRCGSPLCFSLFRSYSWVDATPWISIRWHVI